VLGDLEDEAVAEVVGLERVQDLRQGAIELHVDDGADDLGNAAGAGVGGLLGGLRLGGLGSGFGHGGTSGLAHSDVSAAGGGATGLKSRRL